MEYARTVQRAREDKLEPPPFPESAVASMLEHSWIGIGEALFDNWLTLVHRVTDPDRRRPFAVGIDPTDPLGLK